MRLEVLVITLEKQDPPVVPHVPSFLSSRVLFWQLLSNHFYTWKQEQEKENEKKEKEDQETRARAEDEAPAPKEAEEAEEL